MRDQFGARVIFPQKGTDDDPETIMVIGQKAKAEETKAHLEKLIKDLVCVCVWGGGGWVWVCAAVACTVHDIKFTYLGFHCWASICIAHMLRSFSTHQPIGEYLILFINNHLSNISSSQHIP